MANTVLVQVSAQAENIKALNRVGKATDDMNNGAVVECGAVTDGVFTIAAPTAVGKGMWMVYSPEVVTVEGLKGVLVDPRKFTNPKNTPCDIFKPMVGDLLLVTADGFSVAPTSSKKIIEITANSTQLKAVASATASYDGLGFKYLATQHIAIGDGSSVSGEKVTAYLIECTAN